jgi:DNA-binding winged helix-turn-helix (wHTH) protein
MKRFLVVLLPLLLGALVVSLWPSPGGKVLTHRQILREVWGADHEAQTQYLRVYMARLREKLEPDPATPPLFLTEAGVGYRLAEREEREASERYCNGTNALRSPRSTSGTSPHQRFLKYRNNRKNKTTWSKTNAAINGTIRKRDFQIWGACKRLKRPVSSTDS